MTTPASTDLGPPVDVEGLRAVVAAWEPNRNGAVAVAQADVAARIRDGLIDALDRLDRFELLMDAEVTFTDIEAHLRDGRMDLSLIGGADPDGWTAGAKLLAAIMLHFLLGEENEQPPNYRHGEIELKPRGGGAAMRCAMEVLAPGGKTAHAMRTEAEADRDVLVAALAGIIRLDVAWWVDEAEPTLDPSVARAVRRLIPEEALTS